MGLGAPTGLGLNGEEGGFIPTEAWYREQKKLNPKAEGFQMGQSLNAVIGQGSTRVTLLQMATHVRRDRQRRQAVAAAGRRAHRVAGSKGAGRVRAARAPRAVGVAGEPGARSAGPGRRGQRSEGNGLPRAPQGRRSRSRARPAPRRCGGRATTASCRRTTRTTTRGSSGTRPRATRKIAFAVLIEHGGHGGEVAAPAAMEIVHGYFETVAPDQNAPHIGLPRRHLWRDDETTAARGPRQR